MAFSSHYLTQLQEHLLEHVPKMRMYVSLLHQSIDFVNSHHDKTHHEDIAASFIVLLQKYCQCVALDESARNGNNGNYG